MTLWTDTEPLDTAPSAAGVADMTADRLGSLESRVHVLGIRCDDLIAALKRQAQQLAAHQAAIVRLARGRTTK